LPTARLPAREALVVMVTRVEAMPLKETAIAR
jgi:hypothetical protein